MLRQSHPSTGWATKGGYPISSFCHFTFYEKTMTKTNTDAKTMRNTNKLDRKFCAMGIFVHIFDNFKVKITKSHLCLESTAGLCLNDAKYLKLV